MAHKLKKQTSMTNPQKPPLGALGMHKESRMIAKIQPKIRVIHIFAPEIINTDVSNFRELVQRLTGKPSVENGGTKGKKVNRCNKPIVSTKLEVMMGTRSSSSSPSPSPSSCDDQYHHDQEVWKSACDHNNTSGGYLTSFTDLDDNFDFSTVFHLGAADGSSHHLHAFGENTQFSFRG